jgi:hypothetical protein
MRSAREVILTTLAQTTTRHDPVLEGWAPMCKAIEQALAAEDYRIEEAAWIDALEVVLNNPPKTEDEIRADEREHYLAAIMGKRFGVPSSWSRPGYPQGWHKVDTPCTLTDAANHDNGIIDAYRAIRDRGLAQSQEKAAGARAVLTPRQST